MADNDDAQFTLANVPLGVATTCDQTIQGHESTPGIVTRLHGHVYFLSALRQRGFFDSHCLTPEIDAAVQQPTLNALAALGRSAHREIRTALQTILSGEMTDKLSACRVTVVNAIMHLPVLIGDFTDFSCSVNHALNAGEAVTGNRALPPGFLHFPIGYGGRSSSIVVSGGEILRPWGHFRQARGTNGAEPEVVYAPSRATDFELEVACVVGKPATPGRMVKAEEAGEHVFGFVLLNDWSARDIQTLEMPPLGPFLGKSFGTTISPWIILADALEPFLTPVPSRQKPVANHFMPEGAKAHYAVTLAADVGVDGEMTRACTSQLDSIYWTVADTLAHQTSNGCAVRPGDLLATGTVSGEEKGQHGCLLEITRGGKEAFMLKEGASGKDGKERMYLEDGDTVVLRGWAGEVGSEGCVGFGECRGTLIAANGGD